MTVTAYAWPAAWALQEASLVIVPNVRDYRSQYGGQEDSVDLLGEYFVMKGLLPPALSLDAGAREAFFNRLRGTHVVTAWWFKRPVPVGTQRGTPTLSATVLQGSQVLPLANLTSGATYKAGDMLGVGGQLFQVADDVLVSGTTANVNTVNRAREDIASASVVTWDKPTASFKVKNIVEVVHDRGNADLHMIRATQVEMHQWW